MKLSEIINGAKKIAIAGHIRPDGDCVGAALGVYNYILDNYKEKEVHIYLEQPSSRLSYLAHFDRIETEVKDRDFDMLLIVDLADRDRLGVVKTLFEQVKETVNIDHHVSNTYYAKINHVREGLSSCCEAIYDIMDEDKISQNTAEALYTGIVHDSGVFKYESTTEHTMNVAGKLMSRGLNTQKIIDEGFYEKDYIQNQILGRTLLESMLVLNGTCIVSYLTKKDMDFYGVTEREMGGIVEQLRLTRGVECAIFMYEIANMEFKVSLRSKTYLDVNKVAGYFGGGGHVRAAGCNFKGTVHDAITNILSRIDVEIKAAGKNV